MATPLENLLQRIDPARTIDPLEERTERVLVSLNWKKATLDTWEEYEQCLADVALRLRGAIFNIPVDGMSDTVINFNEAMQLLSKDYPKTATTVFDIVQTGAEGGVRRVLNTLAWRCAEQYARNEIGNLVGDYWDRLSTDEKIAAPHEYLSLCRDQLPQSLLTRDSVRFRGFFWKTLEQHPWHLHELRKRRAH